MFLHKSTLAKLMKQAYKTGLRIATDNGWLYLAGDYWACAIKNDFIPKETLGEIIKLTGSIPGEGEKWECTKESIQTELPFEINIDTEQYEDGPLTITNTLQLGTSDTVQRFVQDESTGGIFLINNVFINLVDPDEIEYDKGEYAPGAPTYCGCGVLWQNNVCRLRAYFRMDEKNKKILNQLKGIDLTPEVPE